MSKKIGTSIDIYSNDIIKEMRSSAKEKERIMAKKLRMNLLQYGIDVKEKDITLYALLKKYVFMDTKESKITNIKTKFSGNRVTVDIVNEKGVSRTLTLPGKVADEFLSFLVENKNATISQEAGFIYEVLTTEMLDLMFYGMKSDKQVKNLEQFGEIVRGAVKGPFDYKIVLPYDASWFNEEELKKYKKQIESSLTIDEKSQLSSFNITSLASEQSIPFLMRDWLEISGGQMTFLASRKDIERYLAISALIYKLRNKDNYPVFHGATDGEILLSSQMLTSGNGEFSIKYDLPEEDKMVQEIVNELEKKNPSDVTENIIYEETEYAILQTIQKRALWYSKA